MMVWANTSLLGAAGRGQRVIRAGGPAQGKRTAAAAPWSHPNATLPCASASSLAPVGSGSALDTVSWPAPGVRQGEYGGRVSLCCPDLIGTARAARRSRQPTLRDHSDRCSFTRSHLLNDACQGRGRPGHSPSLALSRCVSLQPRAGLSQCSPPQQGPELQTAGAPEVWPTWLRT